MTNIFLVIRCLISLRSSLFINLYLLDSRATDHVVGSTLVAKQSYSYGGPIHPFAAKWSKFTIFLCLIKLY
jgi:hypothetical protein